MWRLKRYYRRLYDVVSGLIVRTHVSSFQQLLLSQWVRGNLGNTHWSSLRYTNINSEWRGIRIRMHFGIQSLVGRDNVVHCVLPCHFKFSGSIVEAGADCPKYKI